MRAHSDHHGDAFRDLAQLPDVLAHALSDWLARFSAQPATEDTSIDWEDGEVEESSPDPSPR